jgi:hypothetical protein
MTRNLLALLLATGLLAACDDNNGGAAAPPPPPPAVDGPTGPALADVVLGIFRSTSETALPIDINGLDLDPGDETATLYDSLLI